MEKSENSMQTPEPQKLPFTSIGLYLSVLINIVLIIFIVLFYRSNQFETLKPETTRTEVVDNPELTQRISSLERKIQELEEDKIKLNEEAEYLAENFMGETVISPGKYTSKHGFTVNFPINWYLSAETIEAQRTINSNSHFSISNYDTNTEIGRDIDRTDLLKIEIVINPTEETSLESLTSADDAIRTESVSYGNKQGIKKWIENTTGGQNLVFYYIHEDKFVRIVGYTAESKDINQFDNIARSFQFVE